MNQLGGLKQLDLFERPTVADFLFDKDPLFARLTLSDDELALYQQIYAHLTPQAPDARPGDLPAGAGGDTGGARARRAAQPTNAASPRSIWRG